jgi:hypothetical protein
MSTLTGVANSYPKAVGIEIEYERYRRTDNFDWEWWRTEPDGSLRNTGVEFISAPLENEELDEAMAEMQTAMESAFTFETNYRCGLHVHLCVTDMSLGQLLSTLTVYAIVEPGLLAYCGDERKDNVFCVPWYHTPEQVTGLYDAYAQAIQKRRVIWSRSLQGANKYQALNLLPTTVLGTMEFRMAPAWDNVPDIREWVDMLIRLREFGQSFDNPTEVIDLLERDGTAAIYEAIGLVYADEEYQDEAIDLAYRMVGFDEDEEIDWSLPNIVLDATRQVEEPGEIRKGLRFAVPPRELIFDDEDEFPEYDEDEEYE